MALIDLNTDPLSGDNLSLGQTNAISSTPEPNIGDGGGESSEIIIEAASLDTSLNKLKDLRDRAQDISFLDVDGQWEGSSASQMSEIVRATEKLQKSLVIMVDNAQKALQDASDKFTEKDAEIASKM